MTKKLPYVQSFTAENGTQYNYLRFQQQSRVELPKGPASGANFMAVYKLALKVAQAKAKPAKERPVAKKRGPSTGVTIRDRVNGYLNSHAFKKLAPRTKYDQRNLLCGSRKSKTPSWVDQYGDAIWDELTPKDFKRMLHARMDKPMKARNWLKAVRSIVKDLLASGEIELDPTWGVPLPQSDNPDGYNTWELAYVRMYRDYWPSGSLQRLAFEMLYWTGAACVDVVKLSRDEIDAAGVFAFGRQKLRNTAKGGWSFPEVTPELRREWAACGVLTGTVVGLDGEVITEGEMMSGPILRTPRGLPFTAEHFSQMFRKWARQAGVPAGYSAHGVRKRAATDDAEDVENPATNAQLKAKFGWDTNAMADRYTAKADKRAIALAQAKKKAGTTR